MRRRYFLALGILATYFVASYFVLHGAIDEQRSMQRAISTSGQQRMYSQRIALFADAAASSPDTALRLRALGNLADSIRIFEQAHAALTTGDPTINPDGWPPPRVKHLYFDKPYDVDAQVRSYLAHAHAVEHRGSKFAVDDADLAYLMLAGPGPLLRSLDAVVRAYSAEQQASVATFERLQLGLLALGLSTLAIIWFSIFLPMEREIAERTRAMEFVASHDPLTGLLNRRAFDDRVDAALQRAAKRGNSYAMIIIDIDRLKTINDTHGHFAGDEAISRSAKSLRACARAEGLVARLGGDEFAIFAPEFSNDETRAYADSLARSLELDIELEGKRVKSTSSIGYAIGPLDGTTLRALLAHADSALYRAKERRDGRAVRYGVDDFAQARPASIALASGNVTDPSGESAV